MGLFLSRHKLFGRDFCGLASGQAAQARLWLYYSLRSIIFFINTDVSRYILIIDISILVKSNMGRREYKN
jgi:hypothetical protein